MRSRLNFKHTIHRGKQAVSEGEFREGRCTDEMVLFNSDEQTEMRLRTLHLGGLTLHQ